MEINWGGGQKIWGLKKLAIEKNKGLFNRFFNLEIIH